MIWRFPRPSPSLAAVLAEGFFSRLSFGMIGFTLPLFAYQLGMNMGAIGLLISLSVICEMALKPMAAPLADRFGAKSALTAAITLRGLVALLLGLAFAPWHLFAIRALHGASESLRDPAVNSLIAEHGGKKTLASAFAWYGTAKMVAGAAGRSMAGLLLTLSHADYTLVFLTAFCLSTLPLFAIPRFVRGGRWRKDTGPEGNDRTPDDRAGAASQGEAPLPAAGRRLFRQALGFGALATGTATMLGNLFPLLATQYAGLSEAEAGLVYLVSTLVILFAGPLFGWLSDNVSRKLVLSVRGLANGLSSVLYILFPHFWGVMAARIADDTGKAAYRPAWGELMARVANADQNRRARLMGYMGLAENVGETTGPLLAGFLWQTLGITAMLTVRAILAIITELYVLLVMKPFKAEEKPGEKPEEKENE